MGLYYQIRTHKVRFAKTGVLYCAFVAIGLCAAMIGPTLLDLRQAVDANVLQINAIFPTGSAGYAIGSVIGGIVYEKFDSQLSIASFLIILSVFAALIPWNWNIIGLAITNFLMGIGCGGIDTCANVWVLHLWGTESGPFMQALHFSFGLGAFVAPLLAEPFLSPIAKNQTDDSIDIEDLGSSDLRIQWPYGIAAVYSAIIAVVMVIMYIIKSSDKGHPSKDEDKNREALPFIYKAQIVILSAALLHCYCGLEIAFGRLLTTFAFYSDLHLDKSIGAYMTSVFWGTFTFFRCATVFIIARSGSRLMIWFDIILIMIANAVLLIFGNNNETGLWTGVALMGLGSSSLFPTVFSFVEEYITVTSRIGSIFLICACLGEFTIPFIVGYFIESYPLILIYVTTIAGIACGILFTILCIICRKINVIKSDLKCNKNTNADVTQF